MSEASRRTRVMPPEQVEAQRAAEAADETEEDPAEQSRALRDSFWRWGRVLFVVGVFYLAVQLLSMVGGIVRAVFSVFLYVVFGGIVALVVAPMQRLLMRVMPRALAAAVSLLVFVATLVALVYFVGSPIAGQSKALTEALPRLERPFVTLQQDLARKGIDVSIGAVASVLGISLAHTSTGTALLSAVSFTVRLLVDLVITLIAAFWLLADGERLRRGLLVMLPGRWRTETDFAINAFSVVFGGYIRAQLVLATIVGTLGGLGCWLLGVPFPLVVGVAAGVFELIPLAGPFVGAGIGALFALTVSPALTFETLGLFLAIHIIEGYVISPRIQGKFVQLHPLVTLLALLAGVAAGGFLGAFFAVPLASYAAALARAGVSDLRASQPELFTVNEDVARARARRRTLLAQYRVNPREAVKRAARRVARRVRGSEAGS